MTSPSGKVAWITGAGSGIGRASALRLAQQGMIVVLSGRNVEALEAVKAEIIASNGKAVTKALDVTDRKAVDTVCRAIAKETGEADLLVNCAGQNVEGRHWDRLNPGDWDNVLDVNLNGAANCIFAVLPGMRRHGGGTIINISSWVGWRIERRAGVPYNVSKKALCALTETINMENGASGVRASVVCPAEVATEFVKKRPKTPTPEELDKMLRPEDVADIVAYLAALDSRICVNEVIMSPVSNVFYAE